MSRAVKEQPQSDSSLIATESQSAGLLLLLFVTCVLGMLAFGLWWFVLSPWLSSPTSQGGPEEESESALLVEDSDEQGSFSSPAEDNAPQRKKRTILEDGDRADSPDQSPPEPESPSSAKNQGGANAEEQRHNAEITRYDDNLSRFDERTQLFDSEFEGGLLDDKATAVLKIEIAELMQGLPEGTKSRVRCTNSVCEVELGGKKSLASMMPSLGPWIMKYPDRAAGDARPSFDVSPSSNGHEDQDQDQSSASLRVLLRNKSK